MTHRLLPALLLGLAATACVVESERSSGSSGSSGSGGTSATPTPTATDGVDAGAPTTAVAPMLVVVDTNQTMTASPGDGVGVFVEYKAEGGWHVWWTCDTNKSQQSCQFTVKLSASAPLTNIVTTGTAQASAVNPGVTTFTTVTGASIDGATFSTAPGDILTLDATVDGLADGSFVFFVQDGKVNGGYTGKLTNPLKLQGSSP